MSLILPSNKYKDQWITMTDAFSDEGITGFWLYGKPEPDFEYFMKTDTERRSEKKYLAKKSPQLPTGSLIMIS